MRSPKVFRSAGEMRWYEHKERCKAAVGHMVHIRGSHRVGPEHLIEVKLLAVGRTLATVLYPQDQEPEKVRLNQIEWP